MLHTINVEYSHCRGRWWFRGAQWAGDRWKGLESMWQEPRTSCRVDRKGLLRENGGERGTDKKDPGDVVVQKPGSRFGASTCLIELDNSEHLLFTYIFLTPIKSRHSTRKTEHTPQEQNEWGEISLKRDQFVRLEFSFPRVLFDEFLCVIEGWSFTKIKRAARLLVWRWGWPPTDWASWLGKFWIKPDVHSRVR